MNSLIVQKAGSGRLITDSKGKWQNKEVIDFGIIIGKVYIDGKFILTKYGKVHYSKTGTHIVPFKKEDKL
nr:polymorphic toxin type 50 domain-containing protein [Mammaliicoccus sp. Marseille-Q6498]